MGDNMDYKNFGNLEWRRMARRLYTNSNMQLKWLRAIHKLIFNTNRGWILK